MLSPISLAAYRELLSPGVWREGLPAGMGGTPTNLLCRELASRGQRLTIFTLDPAVEDELVLDGPNLRICIGPYGGPPGRRPARDFFAAERQYLLRAIRRERPDLLHAQWTYLYALAAQASGLPHLITAHDAPLKVLRHELIPFRIAHTLMAYRVLSRARRVISVSPYVATHLRRWMLYRGEPEVIPNGMPQALFDRPAAPALERPGVAYATILNGWSELKNGQAALAAFAEVRRHRPEDVLLMIGYGHGPGEAAERWARGAGLADGVRFVGYQAHEATLRCLAEEVDILVHPSLQEACPMVVLEASALGLAVIGGDRSGGVPWTLDDGRAGVLTEVNSPGAVAEAMLALAGSPSLRAEWGRKARENALRRFHIRVVADAYQTAYRQLAGAAP
jgi:glycosyltransferase involved in cell wall biosynthesis